jgi:hypothetical protein
VKGVLICPTLKVDQEPHRLACFSAASLPTSLIYAVRLSLFLVRRNAIRIERVVHGGWDLLSMLEETEG